MNIVPIVFSFNHFVTMPACICLHSLLLSSNKDTCYDIFIIHGEDELMDDDKKQLRSLEKSHKRFEITFINIGNKFDNVYTARGVPKVTYYRILIPDLITKYEKVIFADVDIIFTGDLSSIYFDTNLKDYYLAAVKTPGLKRKYVKSLGCDPDNYSSGGFQIYNLALCREHNISKKQLDLCGNEYFYLDQDITNIVCKGKIKFISPAYNSTQTFYSTASNDKNSILSNYSEKEIHEGLKPIVIHYNGLNPWQGLCFRHDLWWETYRSSIFFDEVFYFSHFNKILNPSWKFLIQKLPKSLLNNKFKLFYRKIFPW